MDDVDNNALPDDASEADALDQRLADAEDDTGLDTSYIDALGDRDANEADVIDQAVIVPLPEDEGGLA